MDTEPETITRLLEEHGIRDSAHIARRIHKALIQGRLVMLTKGDEHRGTHG